MSIKKDDELINSLNISNGEDIVFLLGAGCSINSGCMPSNKLVQEFKKRIYCAKYGIQLNSRLLIDETRFKNAISQEFSSINTDNEYSFYFERCFPNVYDRNQFIKNEFHDKKPSFGYLCFADYLMTKKVKYVLTTNFDLLIEKAIKRLDENYDLVNVSQGQTPYLSSSLNIVKLHGDYNYDRIKNTENELSSLDDELKALLLRINAKKIIVIGYSGKDVSVLSFLKEYLTSNPHVSLLWCGIEEKCDSKEVNELLKINNNSSYASITGFDSLFEKYSETFGSFNETLNKIKQDRNFSCKFNLVCTNQPESYKTNAYKVQSFALIYKTNEVIDDSLTAKMFYFDKTNEATYFICDQDALELLETSKIGYSIVNVISETLHLGQKIKYIKELVKFVCLIKGIKMFKDNLYSNNDSEEIKTGIKVSIDLLNNDFCLLLFPNYFIPSDTITDYQKFAINNKKSSLFTNRNWDLLNRLIVDIFGGSLSFKYGDIGVVFSNEPINSEDLKNVYECIKEPLMASDTMQSVNQIKILDTVGPKKTLFSPDEIKVGIFCLEEDKTKLKQFLHLVEYGDDGYGTGIIPTYRGFYSTFKKKIVFLYDALPRITLRMFSDRGNNQIVQDFIRGIAKMYNEKQIDIALLFIGENLARIRTDGDFDFHDQLKLLVANKYKTQFLEEKTINSADNKSKILFNFATGIYTKTIGMPWYPFEYSKDTLFLGISFGRDSKGITVGCSQMFDGAGRGMQLIISQISEKKGRKNQYLNEREAFELGKKIRSTYYRTSKVDELKRIVIHRSDPFKKEEVSGFAKAFEGINDFALIQIIEESSLNVYPLNGDVCKGYPIKRGTVIKASDETAYIWTDGSVIDSDVNNGRIYRNSKRGMGRPLKVKKFYGNISLNDVANDLMYLTKMDFNSSDVLYSKLPVTIKYSRVVCDIIKQGNFDDELISFEYVM